MSSPQIEKILQKLKGVKALRNNEYIALCPAHNDKHPSLTLTENKNKILIKCQANCSTEEVCSALGLTLADLFFGESTPKIDREIIAEYNYQDEEGRLLFQVVRYKPKSFTQRRQGTVGNWIYNLDGVRKVLYHLPEVLAADTVYVCEGEKDADRLVSEGLIATTSPGGAGAWKEEYSKYLKNKNVIIVPDNDSAGMDYARAISKSLAGNVSVILPPAKDISLWLDEGGNMEELKAQPASVLNVNVKVVKTISGYSFEWPDLKVTVRRVDVHKDGRVTGEIIIQTGDKIMLPPTQHNFSAARTRKELVNDLLKKYDSWNWQEIFDYLSQEVQDRARAGDEGTIIEANNDEIVSPRFILEPLILEGVPSVIYGDKGVHKTTISLAAIACMSLPWHDNPLGLTTGNKPIKVVYLDWESNSDLIKYTILRLRSGMNIPYFHFAYRRCRFSFVDDIEAIQNFIAKHNGDVLIIDSLGAACGGDLFKPEPALKFFEALRQTEKTSLIIAQNAKGDDNKKSIFGSTYFSYYSRNIWEIRKSDTIGEDSASIGLFHKEGNYTGKYKPMGFSLDFTDKSISIEPTELKMSDFSDRIRQTLIVEQFLKNGAKSVSSIARELGTSDNTARVLLSRMKKRGSIVNVGTGMWGLALREDISS